MTTPPPGTFDRPQGGAYPVAPTEPTKSRSFLLIALAVVAALVIGGGAWAATRALSGGGDQPANALPADTAAYLRLDIDPSVGQKIAAVRFFDGLDEEALDTLRSDDIRKEAFEWLAEQDEAFAAISYDEDIEPWLGDRLGLGVIPNGSEEPYVGIALQVKDEEAADAGLTKLQEATNASSEEGADEAQGLDWFFHGDYAVLTTTDAVGALQDKLEAGTLADDDTFRADMDALGEQGVVSGWVNAEPLADLAESSAEQGGVAAALDPTYMVGSMGGATQLAEDAVTGRYAAALRFSEDNIEVHGVARGLEGMGIEGGDSAQLILDLPEDTAGAFSLEHGDQLVANAYKMFSEQMPDEVAEAEAQASEAGFKLPEDIQTLVGSSLVVSVGPGIVDLVGGAEDPEAIEVAYRTETDTDKAEELLGRILTASGEADADEFLQRRSDDGVFSLAVSQAYLDKVAEGGALGNDTMFQSAVPNAEGADSVFYVNVNAFEDLYLQDIEDEDARNSLEQLGAIGFSSTVDGDGNGEFTFRFVADEE